MSSSCYMKYLLRDTVSVQSLKHRDKPVFCLHERSFITYKKIESIPAWQAVTHILHSEDYWHFPVTDGHEVNWKSRSRASCWSTTEKPGGRCFQALLFTHFSRGTNLICSSRKRRRRRPRTMATAARHSADTSRALDVTNTDCDDPPTDRQRQSSSRSHWIGCVPLLYASQIWQTQHRLTTNWRRSHRWKATACDTTLFTAHGTLYPWPNIVF